MARVMERGFEPNSWRDPRLAEYARHGAPKPAYLRLRLSWRQSGQECPLPHNQGCSHWQCDYFVVKARVSSVFCSTSCALLLPVAGLAPLLRFTLSTGRSPAMRFRRGSMLNNAPMLAGSSCTQTMSLFLPWRSNSAITSCSGNG